MLLYIGKKGKGGCLGVLCSAVPETLRTSGIHGIFSRVKRNKPPSRRAESGPGAASDRARRAPRASPRRPTPSCPCCAWSDPLSRACSRSRRPSLGDGPRSPRPAARIRAGWRSGVRSASTPLRSTANFSLEVRGSARCGARDARGARGGSARCAARIRVRLLLADEPHEELRGLVGEQRAREVAVDGRVEDAAATAVLAAQRQECLRARRRLHGQLDQGAVNSRYDAFPALVADARAVVVGPLVVDDDKPPRVFGVHVDAMRVL